MVIWYGPVNFYDSLCRDWKLYLILNYNNTRWTFDFMESSHSNTSHIVTIINCYPPNETVAKSGSCAISCGLLNVPEETDHNKCAGPPTPQSTRENRSQLVSNVGALNRGQNVNEIRGDDDDDRGRVQSNRTTEKTHRPVSG